MIYRTAPFSMTLNDPNLVFKVTLFFVTEYLTNGYRYGHSYYRRRIGNRIQSFEWHQLQWHWVTSNPDFKITKVTNSMSNNSKMAPDRAIFTMADQKKVAYGLSNGAIFNDPDNDLQWPSSGFQGHAILWHWIFHKQCVCTSHVIGWEDHFGNDLGPTCIVCWVGR